MNAILYENYVFFFNLYNYYETNWMKSISTDTYIESWDNPFDESLDFGDMSSDMNDFRLN